MSDTQKLLDMMARNASSDMRSIGRMSTVMAWVLIIIGGLLTVTVIGAIFGIPILLIGIGLLLYTKSMKKRMAAMAPLAKGAASEIGGKFFQQKEVHTSAQAASD